jgi:23S rRNA (guanosine2251-2'-O)-methyltransferase
MEADLRGPLAIVMGDEGDGVSEKVLKLCDETVSIPISGSVDSLNVSVSAGVILYEVVRQNLTS